jgi:peptidoglycan/LPS O-acetylase OafA/YrhL
VALFMTLSGYLFAKLLDGRDVIFSAFLWNRFLRLMPLLVFTAVCVGLLGLGQPSFHLTPYLISLARGAVFPSLPNGGWSITVEAHFYVMLPLLLAISRRSPWALLGVVVLAILARIAVHQVGDVHWWSYWTIVGRIDQFVLGIFFFQNRKLATGWAAAVALAGIVATFFAFDVAGGYYHMADRSPWIILPTIEGAAFGALIAWYDQHPLTGRWTYPLQKAGEYSYSIYLLHVFFVFRVADFIHQHVTDISNFYLALPWALAFYGAMAGLGYLSFRFIESPFLRYRVQYVRRPRVSEATAPA